MVFVRGKSDGVVGVAMAEEIDLIEFQFAVFGWVQRYAVVKAKGMLRGW